MVAFILCFFFGGVLMVTPIPYLPIMFFAALFESNANKFWEKIVFVVFNIWMLAVPLVILVCVYQKQGEDGLFGLLAGFFAAWYWTKSEGK
jgi:hypothetical protein